MLVSRSILTICIALGGVWAFAPSVKGQGKEERPLVFSRKQHKYNHFANFQEFWMDRPLLMNTADRPSGWEFAYYNKPSLAAEIEQVRAYGLDGLSAFVMGSGLAHYLSTERIWREFAPKDFLFMAEMSGNPTSPKADAPDSLLNQLRTALKTLRDSPYTWKRDGKIVMASYVVDRYAPEEWAGLFDTLRREFNGDVLFVADLPVSAAKLQRTFQFDRANLEKEGEVFKRTVRAYLDVADGVMIASTNHIDARKEESYAAQFDSDFYRNCLIPLMREVLAEPAYQDKLLGLSATKGYINHDSGVVNGENGTARLRESLEIVTQAKPDFISLPEWNEVNENTSFQPTVASSFSTQRILHHFLSALKGEKATALPGDDTSIPNLILSHRRIVKLGEKINFEVLNVPEEGGTKAATVALILKTPAGEIIRSLPAGPIDAEDLDAVVFEVPSEDLADHAVIVPSLIVTDSEGQTREYEKGLAHLQLRPTWNWDYLEVHQPLRDLFPPESVSFEVTAASLTDGVKIKAAIASAEELAQVEILEDQTEVAASDRSQKFDREKFDIIRCQFIGGEAKVFQGALTIQDGGEFQLRPTGYPSDNFAPGNITGNTISLAQRVNSVPRGFFLLIPKDKADSAVLEFKLAADSFQVPVRDILKSGQFAKALPHRYMVNLWRYDKLPDIAPPWQGKQAVLDVTVHPHHPFPVYSLRAITKSGKIFRSRPLVPFAPGGEKIGLNVYSETKAEVVSVPVRRDELPHLRYLFQEGMGDLLGTPGSGDWAGELGGGINYGGPQRLGPNISRMVVQANPQWVQEDGAPALKFDGVGSYVAFPKEAFPHAAFTVRFEIKPESDRDEVLFQHHALRAGSLTLRRTKGKLSASFSDRRPNAKDNVTTTTFPITLDLPADQWSSVEVSYNLKELALTVNGRTERFAFSHLAAFYQASIFGGPAATGPGGRNFQGYLRSFSIDHFAPGEGQP